jgi:hypothetical protein
MAAVYLLATSIFIRSVCVIIELGTKLNYQMTIYSEDETIVKTTMILLTSIELKTR